MTTARPEVQPGGMINLRPLQSPMGMRIEEPVEILVTVPEVSSQEHGAAVIEWIRTSVLTRMMPNVPIEINLVIRGLYITK